MTSRSPEVETTRADEISPERLALWREECTAALKECTDAEDIQVAREAGILLDAYESRSLSSGTPEDTGGGYTCLCCPKPRTAYTRSDLEAVARAAIYETTGSAEGAAEIVTRYLASRTQNKEMK